MVLEEKGPYHCCRDTKDGPGVVYDSRTEHCCRYMVFQKKSKVGPIWYTDDYMCCPGQHPVPRTNGDSCCGEYGYWKKSQRCCRDGRILTIAGAVSGESDSNGQSGSGRTSWNSGTSRGGGTASGSGTGTGHSGGNHGPTIGGDGTGESGTNGASVVTSNSGEPQYDQC